MKKTIVLLLLTAVVVIGVGVFKVIGSLDQIIAEQIEVRGSLALNTKVNVASVELNLLEGMGAINGFNVENPTGYSDSSALAFNTIKLSINTTDVTKMPIVIDEVLVSSLSALYELDKSGKGNLNLLLDNTLKSIGVNSSESSKPPETSERSNLRLVLKKVTVEGTALAIDLTALGNKKYEETLPSIYFTDIGGSQGVTPEALGPLLAKTLLEHLVMEAKKKQTDKLKNQAREKLKESASKGLKNLIDKF